MTMRFTNTEKWSDAWFVTLKPLEKLLFIYLYENCDCAGFIEYSPKRFAFDLGTDLRGIEGATQGLNGKIIKSEDGTAFFVKNYLRHQKNLPLNPQNNSHVGIIKRFSLYADKFKIADIDSFINQHIEGLPSPIGKGIGKQEGGMGETWRNNFNIYLKSCKDGYRAFVDDKDLMADQARLNPGIDISKTIEKSFKNFWGTQLGWKNKKASRSNDIDWRQTIINAISTKMNQVWLPR